MSRFNQIVICLFLCTFYSSFCSPCIHWVLRDINTVSSKLQTEFLVQYHYQFPMHLDVVDQQRCSSQWRVQGYIYRNEVQVPVFESEFGIFGSSKNSNIEILQLNFSVSDLQIPDRNPEHVLIEYSISNNRFNLKEIVQDLVKSFHKQLISIMSAETIEAPIYLKSLKHNSPIDQLDFGVNQHFDFSFLR